MAEQSPKSTVEEIRARFEADVERFSNLETGQTATVDAPLNLELIASASAKLLPKAARLLDIGCGAGNYTLKLMERLPLRQVTLVDLSAAMLARARQRIGARAEVTALEGDIRELELGEQRFDVAVAAAALHHLRGENEWASVFAKVHRSLAPGGWFWISDLVSHESAGVQDVMWTRYGEYLVSLKDTEHRDRVFAYIEKEDTPRPLVWQLDQLRAAGFAAVEVLHKNGCFASFGARRG